MLRVTQQMIASKTIDDINLAYSRLTQTQQQVTTGKQILQPADDPYGAGLAVQLQSELDGYSAYSASVNNATAWQTSTGTALSSIGQLLQQARQLVVQAGNDTNSQSNRANIADQIDQLIAAVKGSANSQVNGQYIFAGTATGSAPYTSANDTYQGDSGTFSSAIGPGVSVQVNSDLHSVLGDGGGDGLVLDTLRTISQNLRGGTTADADALRSSDLTRLDAGITALTSLQASSGATVNRLQLASTRLEQLQTSTSALLSNTQDVDVAKAMIDYSQQQAAYTASLQAGAMILQQSLLNFLR